MSNARIDSIFASPQSQTVPALLVAAELNYTFASTRTQLFIGNRLEDILRFDIAVGLGARQELPDGSIIAASVLTTPLDLEVWAGNKLKFLFNIINNIYIIQFVSINMIPSIEFYG